MNSCHDCVLFAKSGNEKESPVNYQNLTVDILDKAKTKNNIVYCIEKYQVTILATEYGIENLQLPQFLEELGWTLKGDIAVIDHKGDRFMPRNEWFPYESENSKICYLTNEHLLKELLLNPILTNYGVILINDVHKRAVLTDSVLALLKKILRKRLKLKVVLISNTNEAQFFVDYFNTRKRQKIDQNMCILLSIDDLKTKQNIFYLKSPCADYISKSIETLKYVHQTQPLDGDILIYLANEDDIIIAMELLKNFIHTDHIKNINYFKLSHMSNERDTTFFSKSEGKRNIIFTTELYQDSVSQDQISYVIDCGFMQLKWFNAECNKYHNITIPVSKFKAELRAKWLNKYRTTKVFRLYMKSDFNNLPERSIAKMRRTDLCSLILYLKTLAVDNILRFDLPSAPPAKNILSSLEILYALEALDDRGHLTNPLGFFMADASFCPFLSKMLFNSVELQCSEEILSIVAMLQVESAFVTTYNQMADYHKQVAKRAFEAAEGDLITLLNVFTAFNKSNRSKEFCRKYYLSYRNLMRAHNIRNFLVHSLLKKYQMPLISCHNDLERILKCITSGYFMNVAYLDASGVYKDLRCKFEIYIDRDSAIYSLPQPKYLVYCKLHEKSKTFMNNLTVVREEWLTQLAPHYYETK